MLEGVRALCEQTGTPAQLALEAGMACGFGACFGCVVPRRGGGYLRVCVDGPVIDAAELEHVDDARRERRAVSVEFCGLTLAHPVINGSGTFDAIAARRAFGDALLERFPFSAYVSKTITLAAARGQPAAAAVGGPGRADQLDRPAQQGPRGLPARGPAAARRADRRGASAAGSSGRAPVPLITNVMGSTAEELCRAGGGVRARAEIAAIELNVSCPNVRHRPGHRRRPARSSRRSCAPCARAPPSR